MQLGKVVRRFTDLSILKFSIQKKNGKPGWLTWFWWHHIAKTPSNNSISLWIIEWFLLYCLLLCNKRHLSTLLHVWLHLKACLFCKWFLTDVISFFLALAVLVAASSPAGTSNKRWAQSQTATLHSTPLSWRLLPATDNAAKIWQLGERGARGLTVLHCLMAREWQLPFISPKDNWKVK